ncbi:MAG TPA: hypothetical protein VKZ50_11445 [bacterium]|nr:hypothetical protein [bacterium]
MLSVGSKTVLLMANEESAYMNQLAFDVSRPDSPALLAETAPFQFCWGISAAGSLAAFVSSLGATVGVYNPTTLARVWQRSLPAQTHAVATDGTNVFLAQEGTSNFLVLNGRNGTTLGVGALHGGTFEKVYATVHAAGHVYVGDSRLGVIAFDVADPSSPSYVTRFGPGTSNIAANKTRVWMCDGPALRCWDVSTPATPRQHGVYTAAPSHATGGDGPVTFGSPTVNTAGTRLYVTFQDGPASAGGHVSGFYVFDVSDSTPRPLRRVAHQFTNGRYVDPGAIAVDATAGVLALTSYYYGVEIWRRSTDDGWSLASAVPTTGECRDVYVDTAGNQTVLGRWVVTSRSAAGAVSHYNEIGSLFEGWRPYARGAILVIDNNTGSGFPRAYAVSDGQLSRLGEVRLGGGGVTDAAYDGAEHLYVCSDGGFVAGRIVPSDPLSVTQVGALPVRPRWVMLNGKTQAWVAGPKFGVACVDVRDPSSMVVVFHDADLFKDNGICGLCVIAGRVYAACGSSGVRIYDPRLLRRTGAIIADPYSGRIFPTWVEPYTSPATQKPYLCVCHYGDGVSYNPPEGLRIYGLTNPDAPELVDHYPISDDPNFRCRVANGRLYRCALWGVEELALTGL